MEVKLVVMGGKNAGQEVPVTGSTFFVGRAEDCQLRPNSDLVSRHHCVIVIEEGFVALRDFGSKNGTYVNGERIKAERELKSGDRVQIGPLDFEVQLAVGVGGKKKPKVHSVQEAAARTVESTSDEDLDVSQWLGDDEAATTPTADTQTTGATQPNQVFQKAEQPTAAFQPESEIEPRPRKQKEPEEPENKEEEEKKKPVKVVGRFENPKKAPTESSRAAAADMLREFFHRK